jgi:hypothetical protein
MNKLYEDSLIGLNMALKSLRKCNTTSCITQFDREFQELILCKF